MKTKHYLILSLLLLLPLGLLGLKFTGEGGSFTVPYLWTDQAIFGKDEKLYEEFGIIEIHGLQYPATSTTQNHAPAVYDTHRLLAKTGANVTSQFAGNFLSATWYTGEAGSTTVHLNDYLASYNESSGAGSVTHWAGFNVWIPSLHSQPLVPANIWGYRTSGTESDTPTIKNNFMGKTIIGVDTVSVTNAPNPSLVYDGVLFSELAAAPNGTQAYCSDCTFANPCAGAGTGAFAKRLNGAWRCD